MVRSAAVSTAAALVPSASPSTTHGARGPAPVTSAGVPSAFTRIGTSSQPNLFAGSTVQTSTDLARLVAAFPEALKNPRVPEYMTEALSIIAEMRQEVRLFLQVFCLSVSQNINPSIPYPFLV